MPLLVTFGTAGIQTPSLVLPFLREGTSLVQVLAV
jgi:hypothetical protein